MLLFHPLPAFTFLKVPCLLLIPILAHKYIDEHLHHCWWSEKTLEKSKVRRLEQHPLKIYRPYFCSPPCANKSRQEASLQRENPGVFSMPIHLRTMTACSAPPLRCLQPGSRSQAATSPPKSPSCSPTSFSHLVSSFFCSPSRYKDITMKNAAAVNAMDAQIPRELCETSIAVSKHPTKIYTSGKKCLHYSNPSQKESNFSFSLFHRCSLCHINKCYRGKKNNKDSSLEKQNKFLPHCKDLKPGKKTCTWISKQRKTVNKT